jgi:hypothetical protein
MQFASHKWTGLILMLAISYTACGQSRMYVAGGLSNVFGSGVNIFLGEEGSLFKFNYPTFDAEYQTRVIGSFNFLTGVSLVSAGYETTDDSFSSASAFKATYVGVPLMARWNAGNKNYVYVDVGMLPLYLARAHLKESFDKFANNTPVVVEGNITPYSNRFYYAFKFQMLVLVNRFYVGLYLITPSKGQSTLKGLDGHWGLNSQQSTYLLSNGFSDFSIMGFKGGVRIK